MLFLQNLRILAAMGYDITVIIAKVNMNVHT